MMASFARNGFLVLENFISDSQCNRLVKRAITLVEDFEPSGVASIFSASDNSHKSDQYFQTSGDKIRFFFEEDAFDTKAELKQSKALSINKIGHALHDLDPYFSEFSRQPKLASLAASLGLEKPVLLQSMYIFKQPKIGGEVDCHQDSTFLKTDPLSCIGFWFALEEATTDNGCLWAVPGRYPLSRRFAYQRNGQTETLEMREIATPAWSDEDAVPLEVPKGTLIVLDGSLPHFSAPNRSSKSRHAYTLHLIDAVADYPSSNWLRRPQDFPLRGFK